MITKGQEKLAGVYKIWHEKQPKYTYIGSTIAHLSRRFGKHLNELRSGEHPTSFLKNVFNKYGEDGLHCELLEESNLNAEELRQLEQTYIDKFLVAFGRELLMNGSTTAATPLDDPEVLERRLKSIKETYALPEMQEKARASMSRLHNDPVIKAKQQASLAATCARKTKARLDAEVAKKQQKYSAWLESDFGQSVICVDDGNLFENAKVAIEHYGLKQTYTDIIKVCQGKMILAGGKKWVFADEAKRKQPKERKPPPTKKSVRCINNGLVFDCIRHACKWFISEGLTKSEASVKSMISNSCKYNNRKVFGLTFEYTNKSYKKIDPPSQAKLTPEERKIAWQPAHHKFRARLSDPEVQRKQTELLLEANKKLRKPVVCVETGEVYESVSEAARWAKRTTGYKAVSGKISAVCLGQRPSAYGYHWIYLTIP